MFYGRYIYEYVFLISNICRFYKMNDYVDNWILLFDQIFTNTII